MMKRVLMIILVMIFVVSSSEAQPTYTTEKAAIVEDIVTDVLVRIGPPKHLITDEPHTTTSTTLKEGIIPNARVTYEFNTTRINTVRIIQDIPVQDVNTHREAAEKFLMQHHEILGLSESLWELEWS